jgi:hypothetical protein
MFSSLSPNTMFIPTQTLLLLLRRRLLPRSWENSGRAFRIDLHGKKNFNWLK